MVTYRPFIYATYAALTCVAVALFADVVGVVPPWPVTFGLVYLAMVAAFVVGWRHDTKDTR